MHEKLRVLFLCTGKSCRSQMAEGLCRDILGDDVEPFSAGIETLGLNPLAVKVMAEVDIDISRHSSKTLADLGDQPLDVVVTVCGHADETCPIFPGTTRVVHKGFDDPPKLAIDARTEEEALAHYRRVRNEIRDWIASGPDALTA